MTRRFWIVLLVLAALVLAAGGGAAPALAQPTPQPASQPQSPSLLLFTRFPSQEAGVGESVTFPLTLRSGGAPERVQLELQNLPEGWTGTFRGSGRVVHAAYVDPKDDTSIDLKIDTPRAAKPDTYRFTVLARGAQTTASLPLELMIKEKAPSALKLEVELPTLRGAPDTTFRYDAKLTYDGDQNITVNLLAQAPRGMDVGFKLTGQDVTSIPLTPNDSKDVTIEVKPYPDLPAGSYPIQVTAQGGSLQATTQLTAEVTGQANVILTGPDGRLSGQAQIGATTPFKLIVQNTGSAPARNIELSASQPAGWEVTFQPKQIAELPAGQTAEVTANVKPSNQAIAGDYQLTFTARPENGASKSADFRITLLASTLWGVAGIALIAVAALVVGLAVARFGRR